MIPLQRRVISNVSFLHHSLILRTKMVEVLQQKFSESLSSLTKFNGVWEVKNNDFSNSGLWLRVTLG